MADFQEELWKDITGYEGVYQVSNMGRVKTLDKIVNGWDTQKRRKEQIITPIIQKSGYAHVGLWRKQTCKQARVHRLVAEAFCENPMPEKKTQVNHINENKLDNRACNLEWVTPKENTNHGTGIERRKYRRQHTIIQIVDILPRLKLGDSQRRQSYDCDPERVPASTRLPRGTRLGFRRKYSHVGNFTGANQPPIPPGLTISPQAGTACPAAVSTVSIQRQKSQKFQLRCALYPPPEGRGFTARGIKTQVKSSGFSRTRDRQAFPADTCHTAKSERFASVNR